MGEEDSCRRHAQGEGVVVPPGPGVLGTGGEEEKDHGQVEGQKQPVIAEVQEGKAHEGATQEVVED
jgi:hypothetical protein